MEASIIATLKFVFSRRVIVFSILNDVNTLPFGADNFLINSDSLTLLLRIRMLFSKVIFVDSDNLLNLGLVKESSYNTFKFILLF